jgi:prepilin peptidase CpaA
VFALGGMGAGDVKLLGAVGAWLGPLAVVWVALYSGIAGGLLGLIVAGFSGYLTKTFTNVWSLLMYWRVVGLKPAPELTLSTHQGPRLAYAVPVFAGLMVTIWLQ